MTQNIAPNNVKAKAGLKPRAEEIFRGLWASLFYSGRMTGKGVVVCSADRGEGASTVAAGLALAGTTPAGVSRVALVDFNLRNPVLDRLLSARKSPGVAEIVSGGAAPEEAVQRIGAALDLYPVGNIQGKTLEVLRSEALKKFLTVLDAGYDHVIIDAAPVNAFPEAQVLASCVGNALLVTHTDQTPREAVAQAKKRLEAGGAKLIGVVLNLRTYPIPKFLYKRV